MTTCITFFSFAIIHVCLSICPLVVGAHILVVLHVLDPQELDFPFDELSLFEGLEGEESIQLDPESVRQAYLDEMQQFCQSLQQQLLQGGVKYCLCPSHMTLEQNLMNLIEEVG